MERMDGDVVDISITLWSMEQLTENFIAYGNLILPLYKKPESTKTKRIAKLFVFRFRTCTFCLRYIMNIPNPDLDIVTCSYVAIIAAIHVRSI